MARSRGRAPQRKPGMTRRRWVAGVAVLIPAVAVGGWLGWSASSDRPAPPGAASAARRESRPTLEPALFVGKARVAYAVAREVPEVLDRLYCYCGCDRNPGHQNNLDCFTDDHGAG